MNFGQWVLGAVAAGLALGAVHAQAAPMPRTAVEAAVSAQPVQFYFLYDDPPPPAYYEPPPPPRYYYGPPPRRYDGPPPYRSYGPPRGYRPVPPPHAGSPRHDFRNRPEARDDRHPRKDRQRDVSQERERKRSWNKVNGY